LDACKLSYLALASVFLRLRVECGGCSFQRHQGVRGRRRLAAAGHELNVSAAAISRMVHLLEERLGVARFERKANRPSRPRGAYQSGLTPIFDALASLTTQVTAPSSVRVLTIGVGPTFAMRWLIRGWRIFGKNPTSKSASPPAAPRRRSPTTGAVASSWQWRWPGLIADPLFAADLPGLRAQAGNSSAPAISRARRSCGSLIRRTTGRRG
jgi:LysR family glycine cleavage system transcriptional activator